MADISAETCSSEMAGVYIYICIEIHQLWLHFPFHCYGYFLGGAGGVIQI